MSVPSRNGVGASCVALPNGEWPLLLDFLAERFVAIGRAEWAARMVRGDVLDASGRVLGAAEAYRSQQKIFYFRSLESEAPIPFTETILYQDTHLLVVDKPHFLPVLPSGRYLQETLLVRLKRRLGIDALTPIHRIDRETAGLVLFSVQAETRGLYHRLFREREVQKSYLAIAGHRADLRFPLTLSQRLEEADRFMQMRVVEGVPNAMLRIELEFVHGRLARYRLWPSTGQRHQLRVQMNWLGIPILNDQIYPHHAAETPLGARPDYTRPLQLLAHTLAFRDPVSARAQRFESTLQLQI